MSRSITIIAVTGLFGTLGLTFAMSQALTMQPDKLGEGAVKEHFRLRFHPHSESEPRLKIETGSSEGLIRVRAVIEPKITEDRQRLRMRLRDFLWRAEYKSGKPESVWAVFQDPITGLREERRLFPFNQSAPGKKARPGPKKAKPGPKKVKPIPGQAKTGSGTGKAAVGSTDPKSPDGSQSVSSDRNGSGFKSQSPSSKIK